MNNLIIRLGDRVPLTTALLSRTDVSIPYLRYTLVEGKSIKGYKQLTSNSRLEVMTIDIGT